MAKTAIQPTRAQNFPSWYQEVVKAADLAENSAVRGCMVIKPSGFAIWETLKKYFDQEFQKREVENAYFPLFIPLKYFQKEAKHVDGFATECAVVTHHRLKKNEEGELIPASPLEEPLIVRPTSEMIIGESFSNWIHSYRDLPYKINQWANIVRWEMRTRIFLRTAEILWQEGHTAHESKEEADAFSIEMLNVYRDVIRDTLAIPLITGKKTPSERFPGADETYTIEAMMQDRKALQAGTSHFLGQNFSKAADITYQTREGALEHVWTTSWGITTRLIGAMIMVHGDDDGLITPPKVASKQVVILPIIGKSERGQDIEAACEKLKHTLREVYYHHAPLRVTLDSRDVRPGEKTWSAIKKGIPLRIEMGEKELESQQVTVALRNKGPKDKIQCSIDELPNLLPQLLDTLHTELFEKANQFLQSNIHDVDSMEELHKFFKNPDAGFARVFWEGSEEDEKPLKEKYGVTPRVIPFDQSGEGVCIVTNKPSRTQILFGRAY